MKKSRPYFSKDIEDKIVGIINSELSKTNQTIDEQSLRKYLQAGKNTYENGVLYGVYEGKYLATAIKNEIAYKVKPPTSEELDDLAATAGDKKPTKGQMEAAIKNMRASALSHALNMVAMYGGQIKLDSVVVDLPNLQEDKNEESNRRGVQISSVG